MLRYLEKNVNPKNRKTGDCVTRALTCVLGVDYDECLKLQLKWSLKTHYSLTSNQVIEKILSEYGYVKMKQPRKSDRTKYTVGELDKITDENTRSNGIIVRVAHHLTAIVDNYVVDIWDCRNKTVGNYYIKEEK